MMTIRYHPLLDCETDGFEKVPLFFGTDRKTVIQHHDMYLEEIFPRYYRLHSVSGVYTKTAGRYSIHCPLCGKVMRPVTAPRDKNCLGLYACPDCN